MILIEILIFLSTFFPLFHLLNVLFSRRKPALTEGEQAEKAFTILIPCYNEEDTVAMSVQGLLAMDYSAYYAIYINDGSSDGTMEVLKQVLSLERTDIYMEGTIGIYHSTRYENFLVIDKPNGGKSESLNCGLALAKSEYIVTLDADSVLGKSALKHISRAFEDENVVAVGGCINILQGNDLAYFKHASLKKRLLILLQALDYIKGFHIYKRSLSKQNATAIISGAFGAFNKRVLCEVDGYRKTLGEDIDITLRIQRHIQNTPRRVVYLPQAVCFTQCPETWRDLFKQRMRWQKGFINTLSYNIGFILKTFLFKSLTFHFFVEAFVVGVSSSLYTFLTFAFVLVARLGSERSLAVFVLYSLFRLAFGTCYSIAAIGFSCKHNRYPTPILVRLFALLWVDLSFFWLFNMLVYLLGIAAYFWFPNRNNNWDKVGRAKQLSKHAAGG